jgi:hypothetical protein
MRPTLNHARKRFVHRFTCEHKPVWATGETGKRRLRNGSVAYHAPQYRTDAEWYEATLFPGEPGILHGWPAGMPYSRNRTWPLGRMLPRPYQVPAANAEAAGELIQCPASPSTFRATGPHIQAG